MSATASKVATVRAWETVEAVLPHTDRILLYGPPGTGKTSLAYSGGVEPYVVQCHEETSVAEVLGHFIPVGDRFVWMDGPALSAWRVGGRLLIDEIDLASGPLLSFLRGICNDRTVARLTIPNPDMARMDPDELVELVLSGKGQHTLKPGKGFHIIGTMNGLPDDLDEPLCDRFTVRVFIPSPHPDAIKSLPKDLRKHAERTCVESDESRRIGIRAWKAFASLRETVGLDLAARAVWDGRAGDVIDALKLARATEEATPPDPLAPAEKVIIEPTPVPVPTAPTLGTTDARPAAYYRKTGTRGRPPSAECPEHGKMTHRKGYVNTSNGHLFCTKCDTLVACAGTFTKRVKVGEKWISADCDM